MTKPREPGSGIVTHLGNAALPREDRRKLLRYALASRAEEAIAVQDHLLAACERHASAGDDDATRIAYETRLRELDFGPGRPAAFLGFLGTPREGAHPRGLISFEDGAEAVALVPQPELAAQLAEGDTVIVDVRGGAVVARDGNRPFAGETAILEKRIENGQVLVRLANDERCVLHATSALRARLAERAVAPGALLIVNLRQRLAYRDIPGDDTLEHFRFLDRGPVPDLSAEDVGDPNPVIADVRTHIAHELAHHEARRRYGLPRSCFAVLLGPAGTGKSHAIRLIERQACEAMARKLGVTVDALPRRTLTLHLPSIVDKWLGSSDRNLAAFFREMTELAQRPVVGADGTPHLLPVIVKCEEIDGLARRRSGGETDGGAMDRLLTSFLQFFDPARAEFQDSIIVVLCTSNRPQGVDAAALRRLGMRTYPFPRLTRRHAFEAVLDRQLRRVPLARADAADAEPRRAVVETVSAWLFARQDQEPVAELVHVGSAACVPCLRRDFLTAALVNRAVLAAATAACEREVEGLGPDGVCVEELLRAIDAQVRAIADQQLTPETARDYLDLPDGVRVATVKRHARPAVQSFEVLRPAAASRAPGVAASTESETEKE